MAAPPILLDAIGSLTSPGFTAKTSRAFVFGPSGDRPSFIAVYTEVSGKATLSRSGEVVEFVRSRIPRRDPHMIKMASGEEWSFAVVGCGCGNPVRRVNWTQAIKDLDALVVAP